MLSLVGSLVLVMASAPQAPIEGVYLAEDKTHKIELTLREGQLFGRIVWTESEGARDSRNPDKNLRGRPVVGIEHIHALNRSTSGRWRGGLLYNPENGRTYKASVWLDEEEQLVVRGKPNVPILGGLLGQLFGQIRYTRVIRGTSPDAGE